jgi:hypothetical protein
MIENNPEVELYLKNSRKINWLSYFYTSTYDCVAWNLDFDQIIESAIDQGILTQSNIDSEIAS